MQPFTTKKRRADAPPDSPVPAQRCLNDFSVVMRWIAATAVICAAITFVDCAIAQVDRVQPQQDAVQDQGSNAAPATGNPVAQAELRRDPARWQASMKAFASEDEKRLHRDVVFTGSSSVRKWKLDESFGQRFSYVNRGFGGSILNDSIAHMDSVIIRYTPKVVAIYAGDNDLNLGMTVEQVVEDYQEFVQKLRQALPDVRLVYIAIKPSIARWELIDSIRDTNNRIQAITEKHPWQSFADIVPVTMGADQRPDPAVFRSDDLHINAEGYRRWTLVVEPLVEKQLSLANSAPPDVAALAAPQSK